MELTELDKNLLIQASVELKDRKKTQDVLTNLFKTNSPSCESLFVSDLLYNENNELFDKIPEYYIFENASNLKVLALENAPVELFKKKQIGVMCSKILEKLFTPKNSLKRLILRNWVLNGEFIHLTKEVILINCVIDINFLKGYLQNIFEQEMFVMRAPFLYECTCYDLDDIIIFNKLREICVGITEQYDMTKIINNRRVVFEKIKHKLTEDDRLQKNGWISADESRLRLIWHDLKTKFKILF